VEALREAQLKIAKQQSLFFDTLTRYSMDLHVNALMEVGMDSAKLGVTEDGNDQKDEKKDGKDGKDEKDEKDEKIEKSPRENTSSNIPSKTTSTSYPHSSSTISFPTTSPLQLPTPMTTPTPDTTPQINTITRITKISPEQAPEIIKNEQIRPNSDQERVVNVELTQEQVEEVHRKVVEVYKSDEKYRKLVESGEYTQYEVIQMLLEGEIEKMTRDGEF